MPGVIYVNFLKNFKKVIEKYVNKGYKFVIYCGGGRLARNYQKSASKISKLSNEDLDWLGIYAAKLNALLIKTIFRNEAAIYVLDNPNDKRYIKKNIIIGGNLFPGRSTDYDAVSAANYFGVKEVINMSNINYIYDKDPIKYKDAKKIEKISWSDYIKIVGAKWKPGMNVPFDPIAAKEAKKSKIKVNIIGKDLKNLENLLDGKKFVGTAIE